MKNLLVLISCTLFFECSNIPKEISIETIYTNSSYTKLISKPTNSTRPLVVVVPGSGGSFIPNESLFGLVQAGFDVLSIAYFGEKNLPKKIELIPLEYLEGIILFTKSKFPERKVVLLGISKGAEYSLSFASNFHLVDGLICYSPSAFTFPNHVGLTEEDSLKSSWSYKGDEIPFAQLRPFNEKAGEIIYKKYFDSVLKDKAQSEEARIKVENIKCSVLLLSGRDDLVWPSAEMADLIQVEIEKGEQEIHFENISYKDCGHQFFWFDTSIPTHRVESQSMNLTGIKKHRFLYGGTDEGTLDAMVNSRSRIINFLEKVNTTHNKH